MSRLTSKTRLGIDTLEAREVPAVTASLSFGGQLTVVGDAAHDTITVRQEAGRVSVPGVTIRVAGTAKVPGYPAASVAGLSVKSIRVEAGDGNDRVSIITVGTSPANRVIRAEVLGMGGHDTITTAAGDDTVWGGTGNDSLNGGDGRDRLDGGADHDTLAGGTGQDTLLGQAGNDTLRYSADDTWRDGWWSLGGVVADGKARTYDRYDGGAGADTIEMTDAAEALLLVDDTFPAADQRRVDGVEAVRALGGADLVDLTAFTALPADAGLAGLRVDGGGGDDRLIGNGWFRSTLEGNSGVDVVTAGNRADRLTGGTGTGQVDVAWVLAGQAGVSGFETVRVMGVPTDQPQTDNWSCGPNSVYRYLTAYGISTSYRQVRDHVESGGNVVSFFNLGTPPSALIDALRHWKADARREDEVGSADRVVELLLQGKPVIALGSVGKDRHTIWPGIYIGTTGRLHYVTLTGFDGATGRFHYTDTTGEEKTWTRAEFEDFWNWQNHFHGAYGEAQQGVVEALGLRKRTLFY